MVVKTVEKLMTIKETAEYLGLNYMTVYRLAQKGAIPASKVGGSWRFKREIIDEWLMQQTRRGKDAVLVVDDDPLVRELLQDIISECGYRVVTAASGEAAVDQVSRQHFSLVFLDLVLPGLGGIEVLQAIKEKDRSTVVVIVTGYGDDPVALQAMSHGPLLLVRKPFRQSDIVEILNMVLKYPAKADGGAI